MSMMGRFDLFSDVDVGKYPNYRGWPIELYREMFNHGAIYRFEVRQLMRCLRETQHC